MYYWVAVFLTTQLSVYCLVLYVYLFIDMYSIPKSLGLLAEDFYPSFYIPWVVFLLFALLLQLSDFSIQQPTDETAEVTDVE